jgi:cytochrome P450
MRDTQSPDVHAGCPAHAAGAEFRPLEHRGMFEFFARVRPSVPVFYSPEIDHWVVTRFEDVQRIFRDPARFSATDSTQPVFPWPQAANDYLRDHNVTAAPVQAGSDPPQHTRIRTLAARFMNVKQFATYEGELRRLVRTYIDRMRGQEEVDLVDGLTYEYPAQAVFLLLGERNFDPRRIKAWGDLRGRMIWGRLSDEEMAKAVEDVAEFWQYTVNLVEERKQSPKDDYISAMLALRGGDDAILTDNEIKSTVFGLLFAGHETTTNAAGNLLIELLRRPEHWQKLVAEPRLIPYAVEEALRFASPVVAWRRRTLEDVEIAGTTIPKGSSVLLSLASANRDEHRFTNGETFDIERRNTAGHLAFGTGIHHCLGAPLARRELRIILEELTAAFPDMRLVEDQEIDILATVAFRGPARLMVRLNR